MTVSQAILKAVAVCIAVLGALFASSGANSQQPKGTACYCICATTGGLWGELHAASPRGCPALVGKSCRVLDRVTRGVSSGRTINCGPSLLGTAATGAPPR
jgi:hypothetical protein